MTLLTFRIIVYKLISIEAAARGGDAEDRGEGVTGCYPASNVFTGRDSLGCLVWSDFGQMIVQFGCESSTMCVCPSIFWTGDFILVQSMQHVLLDLVQ